MSFLNRFAPLLLVVVVWELVCRFHVVPPGLLPSPSEVWAALVGLVEDGDALHHGARSLYRGLIAFGSAVVLGTTLGVLMASVRPVRIAFNPLVQMLYPMPKSALIPVMMMWFGIGDMSKIAAIFMGCLLPMVMSSFNGARGVNPVLRWSAASLGASRFKILRTVVIPAALPDILAGTRLAVAFTFLFIVSSEFIIATDGIGYLISGFGDSGSYPAMFAAIFLVASMGFTADQVFKKYVAWQLRWREA